MALQRTAGNRSVTTALISKRASAMPHVASEPVIQRKKEARTPFAGWAGEADVRATEAAANTGGLVPIQVKPDYTVGQAKRKEEQMEKLLTVDLGDYYHGSTESGQYKKLVELRQGYLDDVPRLSVAQGAYNDFVVPATLAAKSVVQFRTIQSELGFSDDDSPAGDLTTKERGSLAKGLDEKEYRKLNETVENARTIAEGKRTEILGIGHNLQGSMQRKAALLAKEEQKKAEAEKAEITEKIKAVTEGIETVGKVVEAVSFAGFGAPEAISGIGEAAAGEGLGKGIKGGLELGSKATSLLGMSVEFIMTQRYKEELDRAQTHIMEAQAAVEHAKALGVEFEHAGWLLQAQGAMQELKGFMGQWAQALSARKNYMAQLGAATDKSSGNKAGGNASQYLAMVAQAAETVSFLDSAQAAADNTIDTIRAQVTEMSRHRKVPYAFDEASVFGTSERYVDGDGPDIAQLRAALDQVDQFASEGKHASRTYKDNVYQKTRLEAAAAAARSAERSMPAAE